MQNAPPESTESYPDLNVDLENFTPNNGSVLAERHAWEFAGWGSTSEMVADDHMITESLLISPPHKLGQIPATAISGNDITSSCLYVVGLSVAYSGKFSPLSLFLVVIVLYLFRNVYAEVGSALPLNGGAYNVLLNTTSKHVASLAAALTMLSYVATAVVSASEAMEYAQDLVPQINPSWATIALLALFAILNLIGISESSKVATAIFAVHCFSLTMLIICCTIFGFKNNWVILEQNWALPPINGVGLDLFYGFCSGLLGVSGFETSANFIEEQDKGVFPKTLRNMWVAVAFFNPLSALLCLATIPYNTIITNQRIILSTMGLVSAGYWLQLVIAIDAALVLSGAVLTGYVGITGLVHRMALDRLLPNFLLHKNPLTHTNHWIIIGFFLTTSSLYLLVRGNVQVLSGVYTVSFLSVMSLFAIGNMLLKYKRSQLPREIKTRWVFVLLALTSVAVALIGNVVLQPSVLEYFAIYFCATIVIVGIMIGRVSLMRFLLFFLSKVKSCNPCTERLKESANEIRNRELIFYTRKGDIHVLNKAIMYVRDNESSNCLTIVHAHETEKDIPSSLKKNVEWLDRLYPKIRVNLLLVRGKFSPRLVESVGKKLGVPKNYMFMACPNSKFPHNIGEFGGVRLITH